MDVNQVRFGSYSIGNPQGGSTQKSEEKASEAQTQNAQIASFSSADDVMEALGIAGMQNLVFVSKTDSKEVNPADYLDEKRISDIEAMMAEFDSGVSQIAEIIGTEFSGKLDPAQTYALAAQIYAAEQG